MAHSKLAAAITIARRLAAALWRPRALRCNATESPAGPQRYRDAVRRLPDDTRMIFLLHAADELGITEIAAQLSLTTGQVEERLAAAITALLRDLDDGSG